ncbi:MAG: T9SS type B sorting domain-containing protein, partial [Saprospiraceae bacterium]
SASLGVFETQLTNLLGCDSTIFTTITYAISDSTYLLSSSCDPAETGVFLQHLTNQFGCDSIVTTTVAYAISDYININTSTCDPADTGVFVQHLVNENGCDSVVTETVTALPHDHIFLMAFTCDPNEVSILTSHYSNQFGCDSAVTSTVSLFPSDTTIISFKTCDPGEVSILTSHYSNQNGCDSVVIDQTTLYNLPSLNIASTSNFNGYDISCFGESDGSVNANIAGISPFDFIWNTGSKDQNLTGLPAGSYSVTVTDANGCVTTDEITLVQSEQFMIGFTITSPDCFDQHNGIIIANQAGGVEPVRYSIDGISFQPSPTFNNLSGGTYTMTAFDANDCEVKEIIWINVPLMINVELGDNQVIMAGDTVLLNAIINVPFDSLSSISWTGLNNPACPTCLTQPVVPIITTTYSVTVTTEDGCWDEDALTLFIEKNTDIYVPNIFSPNGDNSNDRLLISAGPDVEEISSFIIFDRWGNVLFAADHFQPNDLSHSWDGTFHGRPMNSSVFAYKMIVEIKGGGSVLRFGDVTLVR